MAFTASNGRTQTSLADINITPLVDVVLVLLTLVMPERLTASITVAKAPKGTSSSARTKID